MPKVVEGRTEQYAEDLWNTLSEQVRNSIEAVAMDIWEAYMKSARIHVPQALIVHDWFHIAAYLAKSVNQVRHQKNKRLVTRVLRHQAALIVQCGERKRGPLDAV